MRRMKVPVVLILVLFTTLFIFACTPKKNTNNYHTNILSELNNCIVEKVIENYEDGTVSATEIAIDQIYYGSFSQDGVAEILVTCKILNSPHVAGLDKTVGLLLTANTLETIAYKEFAFDKVVINCMESGNGKSRILVLGTVTSQGISIQCIQLCEIQDNQWVEYSIDALKTIPIDSRNSLGSEYFCFSTDDCLIISYEDELTNPAEIIAILIWDPDTSQFVLNP